MGICMEEGNGPVSLEKLRGMLDSRELETLNKQAAKSSDGVRRHSEEHLKSDYRQHFAVDVDRILHSMAYTRYIDKTQVFYLIRNDHITHRMLHVQLVSKAARTIGRFLGLNEDLIEAIAIGHDIGHPPFGHDGERILSDICTRHGIGQFHHNVQSVHFLDKVERQGRGWNLCLQTLDGILCHDGEIHNQYIEPVREKSFADHESEIKRKIAGEQVNLAPMSLEGCVVRFADTVSYIGRDIEDAIRLGLIRRSDLPVKSVACLGDTNGRIVYSLVTDIILNSYQKPYISFSPEISEALRLLKKFNYERIYMNPVIKKDLDRIRKLYEIMYDRFLGDLASENHASPIFKGVVKHMTDAYMNNHSSEEIVRDFISGMTDQYFIQQSPEEMRPAFQSL